MPSFPTRTEGPYHGRQRQHRQWSFPTRAEVPETCGSSGNRCCFFSRTHVSRNQKWLSVIYPVFSRVHGSPLPVASKHRPEGVFSEHTPPQPPVSAGCSGSGGLVRRARKGTGRKGSQTLSDMHGKVRYQLPPSPPRPSIVFACASCMRSASRVPRSFCVQLPSWGPVPSCGPSQHSPGFGHPFRPSKNSPAVSRQKQLRRHAEKKRRESPHAFPLPDGAQPSCTLPARPPVPFRQGKRGPLPVVMLSLYQVFHILVENTPVMLSSSSFPFLPSIKIHKKVEFIFFEITI